ncbi:uncharacterized protein J4E78_007670 [Alternaria triticimaculans]|uniref:uncharacterized protein n=1 Tax=Alternaria triticimaculans TaxID=297637 RepID=UPI0020C414BC|nr:uncharacterized protein J4E78_007670 [Alternaria triticimaculans]KAI4652843.1 hypothetical protein J4E78_007670 [Alternaria triticimaculans]
MDISAFEHVPPVSKEEPTQREINDRRLAQAIRYLDNEGGDDTDSTYMNHVERIDEDLLQRLPPQERNFDDQLYERAQAMIRQARLEYEEEVAREYSSSSLGGDSPKPMMIEDVPDSYTPSAAQALYRRGDTPDEPQAMPRKQVPAAETKVRREERFKYGGPNNEPERWHKNYPASLPFPETFQMAHWESLKIDFDLSESGKKMKAEGKIVETNIPFDRPELEQYKNLPVYESGSRFKLPIPSAEVQEEISKLGTPGSLAEIVEGWNQNDDKVRAGNYKYAPRVFLDKFSAGTQVDPTTIRDAVNTTPVKSRTGAMGRSIDQPRLEDEDAHAIGDKARAAQSAARIAREKVRKAEEALNAAKQANLEIPTRTPQTTSPVARKLNRERATSLERSPRRQSGVSTAAPSPASPDKTSIHPQVVIPKRPNDRQTKPTPDQTNVATPKTTTKKQPKRKRSLSEQNYTPETKRSKSIVSSSRKSSRTKTQKSPDKAVHFQPDESDDSNELSDDDLAKDVQEFTTVVTSTKTKPTKKTTKTTAVTKKMSKAAAAGKAARKAKAGKEVDLDDEHAIQMAKERRAKSPGRVVKGSTRSGMKYLKG